MTDGFKTLLNVVGNGSNAILLGLWEPAPATPSYAAELVLAQVRESDIEY